MTVGDRIIIEEKLSWLIGVLKLLDDLKGIWARIANISLLCVD